LPSSTNRGLSTTRATSLPDNGPDAAPGGAGRVFLPWLSHGCRRGLNDVAHFAGFTIGDVGGRALGRKGAKAHLGGRQNVAHGERSCEIIDVVLFAGIGEMEMGVLELAAKRWNWGESRS
jgi:hypothetical protein